MYGSSVPRLASLHFLHAKCSQDLSLLFILIWMHVVMQVLLLLLSSAWIHDVAVRLHSRVEGGT